VTERGSVSLIVAATMAVLVVVVLTIVALAGAATASERAIAAAEAAALAAAPATFPPLGGDRAPAEHARALAVANGAVLLRCDCPTDASYRGRTVVVTVRYETTVPVLGAVNLERTAAAEFEPVELLRN